MTEIRFDGPFPSTNAISSWSLISLVVFTNVERRAARTAHVHKPSIGLCAEHSGARQLGIKEAPHARVVRRERRHQNAFDISKSASRCGETWYGSTISPGHPRSWCQSEKPGRRCSMDVFESIHACSSSFYRVSACKGRSV